MDKQRYLSFFQQLACDLQSQFTALNYMQRVAPVNPKQTHLTPTFASNLTLKRR